VTYVIAQISDVHIGGPNVGSGERFSMAVEEINQMLRAPDLLLLTGDLTHNGTVEEWSELCERLAKLKVRWDAIPGNHDRNIASLAGHRAIDAGPLRLILLDTSSDVFSSEDAGWLEAELQQHRETTVIAIHQPPFETGIWWMDCVGLKGADLFEAVVRRHDHVIKVLSGHIHRLIQTSWGPCSLWVCPSTSVSVAVDLSPAHEPAETAEAPTFSLHVYTGAGIVSHVVPVGRSASRSLIVDTAPEFVSWVRGVQDSRESVFK
jgi:3',5'-cyclic-AMP phosphodiesterase